MLISMYSRRKTADYFRSNFSSIQTLIQTLPPVFHPGYEKNLSLIRAEVSDRSQKVVFRFLT